MEFVHKPYLPGQTVAAIATPPGEGGVAIIRISGTEAVPITKKIFSGAVEKYVSHTVHFGRVSTLDRRKIDDVLLIVMRAPRSFTGEDVVEIHCHGGSLIAKEVLGAVLSAGALPAAPGEFSFKAYMNGKIDLAQAEAIQGAIGAKNEYARISASKQLDGLLSGKIGDFQKRLTHIAAIFEAWVDFPEEDLEFSPFEEVIIQLQEVMRDIKQLIETFHQGKIISSGITVACIGSPNVGKSSLMNALLGKNRAIVSSIPGTTRDSIEESMQIGGIHLRLIDTAGIRHTENAIEEEGIRRSRMAMEQSDVILYVLDVTRQDEGIDSELPQEKTIVCWNKIDLDHSRPLRPLSLPHSVEISAEKCIGIDQLHNRLEELIWKRGAPLEQEVIITSLRHKNALVAAHELCQKVVDGLQHSMSAEFVASDMKAALVELGTIIGTNVQEDILTAVFSSFCIGK